MIREVPLIAATLLLAGCPEPQPTVDQFKGIIQKTSELEHVKGDLHDRAQRVLGSLAIAERECAQSAASASDASLKKAVDKLNKSIRKLIKEAYISSINPEVKSEPRYVLQLEAAQNLKLYNGWQAKCVNVHLQWEISYDQN